MIKDHKNRLYELIGVNNCFTLMKCLLSGDMVKVANQHFTDMGFKNV